MEIAALLKLAENMRSRKNYIGPQYVTKGTTTNLWDKKEVKVQNMITLQVHRDGSSEEKVNLLLDFIALLEHQERCSGKAVFLKKLWITKITASSVFVEAINGDSAIIARRKFGNHYDLPIIKSSAKCLSHQKMDA